MLSWERNELILECQSFKMKKWVMQFYKHALLVSREDRILVCLNCPIYLHCDSKQIAGLSSMKHVFVIYLYDDTVVLEL